ncbi:AI-2E family transporter [uncultured Clostridium sp.]|uniref:AI-2E family transporter n=1 Tax=uncultured Clostridium sp. TaxID=59620 RepID=UPI0034A029E5
MISYVIANITVYFILVDKRIFIKFLNFILPYDVIETIIIKKNNLGEVIKIEIKLVIICMIITIVGFKILNVPSAIFLGVICGILDILPYVGTIIVFIPIIIYNIIMKKYLLVVGLIALYLLLQIIREVLELKFLSSKLDIHPLVVMLSMYIGAEIFGIIGILIGPIYCLIAKDLIYEGTL